MSRRSTPLAGLGRAVRVLLAPAQGSAATVRLQTRLMGSMLLVLLPLFGLMTVASLATRHQPSGWLENVTGLVLIAGTTGAYQLSRRGRQRAGARLLCLTTILGAYLSGAGEHDPIRALSSTSFSVLAVLYASFLLSPRDTVLAGLMSLLGVVLLPLVHPVLRGEQMVLPAFFVLFTSSLVVVAAYLRQNHTKAIERRNEQLSEGERRLRVTIDSSLDAVVLCDERLRVVEWSLQAERMFGHKRDDAVTRELTALVFAPDTQERVRELLEAARLGGASPDAELEARRADGAALPVELSASGLLLRGRPACAVFMRDLSDRRRMQAELMQNDRLVSVGRLAAGVAHEINNPMTYVLSNLQFAQDFTKERMAELGARGPELDEVLSEALDGARRVQTIVKDLRTFSRTSSEEKSEVQLARVLDGAVQLAWNEIRHRAKLEKDYRPVPPVLANEARLGQVFLNLLVNAAQALPPGRSDHLIRVALACDAAGRVVASVSDTGHGIAPDVQARLFAPFFTTKPVGQGTGLGLYISRSIVTAFGGELQVESAVGRGATFSVVLPPIESRTPETLPAPSTDAPAAALATATDPPLSVLVIDDDPNLQRSLSRILSRHRVTTASDSQQALLRCAAETFDLVLCDVMMPGVTGVELAMALEERGLVPAEKLVFVTGGAVTAAEQEFLARHPERVLEKPVAVAALDRVLEGAARLARATPRTRAG